MDIKVLSSGSHGNAYVIDNGDVCILMECGIRWKEIVAHIDKMPDYCTISHEHGDHSRCVKDVIKRGIPICCSDGTAEALGIKEYQRCYPENVILLPAIHNAKEPSMFVIDGYDGERLFFATDTESIPHTVDAVTHLMLEANWSKFTMPELKEGEFENTRVEYSHLSLEKGLEWVEKMDKSCLQEIHLIHLSNSNSDAEFFKSEMIKASGAPVRIA